MFMSRRATDETRLAADADTWMSEGIPATLTVADKHYTYWPVSSVSHVSRLPYSLRILMENVLRCAPTNEARKQSAQRIIEAAAAHSVGEEVEFSPARVLFQDFTGVPVFVDFAVIREACKQLGGDPAQINPHVPCDLVIDHSVIADEFGCAGALEQNTALEFTRNRERYAFLKWAQRSFQNVRIVPPGQGICHQLNIERFATVATVRSADDNPAPATTTQVPESNPATARATESNLAPVAATQSTKSKDALLPSDSSLDPVVFFDTLVGTDSHTPTANGIGVLGWGVGGIEAEAAALGQPITILVPQVVGVRFTGSLSEGVSAMDLSLHMAALLRAEGVVGCFVECFGPGVAHLSATQRTCVSNMTPEYGCTCTLFPVDDRTLDYLRVTGRSSDQVELVEAYAKAQGLWNSDVVRDYAKVLEVDLSQVERGIAGPSRPHEHIAWSEVPQTIARINEQRGLDKQCIAVELDGNAHQIGQGALAIAAITSCTTATDPAMMLACGLLARNAVHKQLHPKPWVKTILAPGSKATELLLERAGLVDSLRELGFYTCGFGCMSCIGNSGPILEPLHAIASQVELASVLSGNRNFEGRISPDVSQNYLSAPAGVVAYALAGRIDFDFEHEPLGQDSAGCDVFLHDIWPSDDEVATLQKRIVNQALFSDGARGLYEGDSSWRQLEAAESDLFSWDSTSTYVRRAPYFDGMQRTPEAPAPIRGARVLALLGDFITTDHISPAGSIAADSAAARLLREAGVAPQDFNTYGARRGNHEVMMRGTFANVKLKNSLAEGRLGGWTRDHIDGQVKLIFDVAQHYRAEGIPTVVIAGKMYGSGSSRDWAAKGPALLGVRAVIAQSFERIHRSNLVGMGILPLQFKEGQSALSFGLTGTEVFDIAPIDFSAGMPNPAEVAVTAQRTNGEVVLFNALVRIDTPTEGAYFRSGGILAYVLRNLMDQ